MPIGGEDVPCFSVHHHALNVSEFPSQYREDFKPVSIQIPPVENPFPPKKRELAQPGDRIPLPHQRHGAGQLREGQKIRPILGDEHRGDGQIRQSPPDLRCQP